MGVLGCFGVDRDSYAVEGMTKFQELEHSRKLSI